MPYYQDSRGDWVLMEEFETPAVKRQKLPAKQPVQLPRPVYRQPEVPFDFAQALKNLRPGGMPVLPTDNFHSNQPILAQDPIKNQYIEIDRMRTGIPPLFNTGGAYFPPAPNNPYVQQVQQPMNTSYNQFQDLRPSQTYPGARDVFGRPYTGPQQYVPGYTPPPQKGMSDYAGEYAGKALTAFMKDPRPAGQIIDETPILGGLKKGFSDWWDSLFD